MCKIVDMQVLISCVECGHSAEGHTEKELMNKIVMWNHMQKEHPATAERIMRLYNRVPTSIYTIHTEKEPAAQRRFVARYA